jgi:hypothetical protein
MGSISSFHTAPLTWSKVAGCGSYELLRDGESIASMRRLSFWSPAFLAESPVGSWRFLPAGCLQSQTDIVSNLSGVPLATFRQKWSGVGTLAFQDGQTFRLTSNGFWRPTWTVLSSQGETVLDLRVRERIVQVSNATRLSEERLTMLAVFVWYVAQRASEDTAAIVGAVAVAT